MVETERREFIIFCYVLAGWFYKLERILLPARACFTFWWISFLWK